MSSSNLVSIAAIEEVDYGVTPPTGNFKTARFVMESLSGTPQTTQSAEIHADRMASGNVQTGLDVNGDIDMELSADPLIKQFIQGAMMNKTTEKAAEITGQVITVDPIGKTLTFTGAVDLQKGDLIFLSGFTEDKNNGMAYVNSVESAVIAAGNPAVLKNKITATPSDVNELEFTFVIKGGATGDWSYGDPDATIDQAVAFTYPVDGPYTVTFTDGATGAVSTLALNAVLLADTPVVQVGADEILTAATPAVAGFVVKVGKETIASETSTTSAKIVKGEKLTVGTDIISFSICKQYNDLTDKSVSYLGMLVNQMAIQMNYGAIAKVNFGFLGNGYETPDTPMTTSRTVEEASTTQPLNATSDIGTVFIDGQVAKFCVQKLDITLNNGSTPQQCLGSLAPRKYSLGQATVNVAGSAYLADENWSLMEKKLTQEPVSIAYSAQNKDGGIAVLVHGAQLSFPDASAMGLDQQVSIEFTGTAKKVEEGYFDIYFF
jgi:hypothetical protein